MTHSPASTHLFESIEQLDELPRNLGWPLEYRQIEPGSFSSTFTSLEGDSWFLLEEQSSRRVEVAAGAPSDMFVLALVEGREAVINGESLSSDLVVVQSPGSDLLATLPAGLKATQVGVDARHFEDVVRVVAPNLSIRRGEVSLIAAAPGRLASMRRAMSSVVVAPSERAATREEAVSRVVADLAATMAEYGDSPRVRTLHSADARRSLGRSREYIEAHLGDTIRVESMCRFAGTTLRSLERIFARELGVSPQQYVKARRLNAVRRRLRAADDESLSVTEVALRHGFAHLGRFAGDYRRYFGESPRETLRGQ